jgi:CDP-diacylglycerol---glycerol-3-phosphate 3-phosphatidyltransferase
MSISIYQLKPKFQQLLSPLIKGLMALHITPNQVTLGTMLLSLSYGLMLAYFSTTMWLWLLFPMFMLLRMALNAIDGMLANASQQKTKLGALLNEICDQVSDIALYLPFALLTSVYSPLLVLTVLTALLAEFTGVTAALIGTARRFDGPMGKSDRAFAFSILAIFVVIKLPSIWINGSLMLVLLLSLVTLWNRAFKALKNSTNAEPPTP